MKSGPVAETYQKVCDGFQTASSQNTVTTGRDAYIARSEHNEDTIVLFCHMGVTFYMLSHLFPSFSGVSESYDVSAAVFRDGCEYGRGGAGLWDVPDADAGRHVSSVLRRGAGVPYGIFCRRFCRSVRYDRTAGHGRCTIDTSACRHSICAIRHSVRLRYAAICSASDRGHSSPYSTDACTLSFSGR